MLMLDAISVQIISCLEEQAEKWFAERFVSRGEKANRSIEALGEGIFGVNGEADTATFGIGAFDMLDEGSERFFTVAVALIPLVNEKVIHPILVG